MRFFTPPAANERPRRPGRRQEVAYGINATGQVVGGAGTAEADYHAFVYDGAAGKMIDLEYADRPRLRLDVAMCQGRQRFRTDRRLWRHARWKRSMRFY